MIKPALQDDAFLADVAAARADLTSGRLYVWWLGQSGFLVCHAGDCLLFDPYLSDSLTKKYAGTDKPHERMTERVVAPERLDFVDVLTSSHNHTDHLDAETLGPLFTARPDACLVLLPANEGFAATRLGPAVSRRFVPVAFGERVRVGPFAFEAVPAAHDDPGPGYGGFVVTAGPFRLYHSGDTRLYPGIGTQPALRGVDLALLPINGAAPERRVAGNLDGPEAARLAHAIGARWVVPCHYEMFAFNTASPAAFVAECARLGQPCRVLRAGERWSLPAPPDSLSR